MTMPKRNSFMLTATGGRAVAVLIACLAGALSVVAQPASAGGIPQGEQTTSAKPSHRLTVRSDAAGALGRGRPHREHRGSVWTTADEPTGNAETLAALYLSIYDGQGGVPYDNKSDGSCSGVLIGQTKGLTAAHCVDGVGRIEALIGSSDPRKVKRRHFVRVTQWMTVRGRRDRELYDVAVLELPPPTGSEIRYPYPISTVPPPARGSPAFTRGYGATEVLGEHQAPIKRLQACGGPYRRYVTAREAEALICAGLFDDDFPPCSGDSGAPLYFNSTVIGILSGDYGKCGVRPFIYINLASVTMQDLLGRAQAVP